MEVTGGWGRGYVFLGGHSPLDTAVILVKMRIAALGCYPYFVR